MRLIALALSVVLSAPAQNDLGMQLLDAWIAMLDRHSAGAHDESITRLGAWNYDELSLVRRYADALTQVPTDTRERSVRRAALTGGELAKIKQRALEIQSRGNFDTFRKRAVMLHTDAAVLDLLPDFVAPPAGIRHPLRYAPPAGLDVKSFDGRVDRYEMVNPHWQIAMDLLAALPAKPQRDPIVAQWYRTFGAFFAHKHRFADALRHFDEARRVVPDDPGVLLAEAAFQETMGSPRIQNLNRVTALPQGMVLIGMSSAGAHHRRAEQLLKRALAARPDFAEAQLRLGRVLAEQDQYDAALPYFAQVAARSRDPQLTYYAHLFNGEALLALGRPQDAGASFEHALAAFPHAQAARLGLAAALRAAGDREAAIEQVMTIVTVPAAHRDADDDPWWTYYEGDDAGLVRLLDEFRAPYLEPGR